MLVSQQQSSSNDGAQSQDPIQTESEFQWSFDPLFDNLLPDGLRSVGPPEHPHGGFGMSDFNPGWPLTPNMAGQPAYHSPEINFGAPSINQGFNSSIPSHVIAQQHQSNTGDHFPPSNPPLDNFSSHKLFDPSGFSNAASLAGPGHGVPTQPFATHGASVGDQSLQVNRQAPPLAGSPFQAPIPPHFELQATRDPPLIPSHPRPEAVLDGIRISPTNTEVTQVRNDLATSGLPIPVPGPDELSLGQDEMNVRMPDWIALVKPSPPAGENVVTMRRDTHVALDIIFERLPRQPPGGCGGIKIPATASVRNFADTTGKTLLELRIHVSGATSKRRYETVCGSCEKREGNKNATPSFIDFYSTRNIIEQKDGKVRVEFAFCCYPKCQRDSGYSLDVVLSEDVNQENIVAQYRLPFSFNVVAKLPQGQKRTRRQMEESEEPSVENRRNVRARFHDSSRRDTDHEQNDDPMLAVNPRNDPQGGQYREGDPSNASPPTISPPQPPQNAGPNPGPLSPWKPVIAPPRTDAEPTPTLTDVNPEQGSITGGARIWLKGMEFPAHFPLFARFGSAVVPTTYSAGILLACNLPPATTPGVVDVTLSKHPQPNAPEYGTSIAKFRYVGDHAQLIPILLRFQEQGYPEFSPVLQALLTSLGGPQPNRGLQGGSHGTGPQEDPIETRLIEALVSLQARPKFHEIVSTTNDYHQTLAHLSILYNYPSLLGRLVEWHIDPTIADVNGLTALHCAYLKGDLDSVQVLRRGGASEIATDRLGRTPWELQPEGLEIFDSDIDPETELAGLDAGVYSAADDIDEQLTIGKQFSALDLDNCIESGQGQLEAEDDASEDKEPDGTVTDSPTGGNEGDNGGIAGGGGSASDSGGAQITSSTKEPVIIIMNHLKTFVPIIPSQGTAQEKWLIDRKSWQELLQESWYLNQEVEPLNHSGQSILCRWIDRLETREKNEWGCCVPLEEGFWCTYRTLRLDRAITHVRDHLGLKPYPCEEKCGNQSCTARFSSNGNRYDHYNGRTCEWCKKKYISISNLHRHMNNCREKWTLSDSGVSE